MKVQSSAAIRSWDPVWDRIFSSQEWGKYPPEHVVRFIARNFYKAENRENTRLLELGCGPGANLWFMAREGFSVAGIDGSSSAIKQATERLSVEHLVADLIVGDYRQLPWASGIFDGALENVSFYCNPRASVERALKEVRRVLKPGAVFQSSFFSDRTWGFGLGDEVEPNGFVDIPEGPIKGSGFALFVNRTSLLELFRDFQDHRIERVSWTLGDESHLVEQYVVFCRNPS